ncbi:MAG TPA: hypothetical protein VK364_13130 [Hymenobacter sp.]|jgi:hypothetical protein|nr:hypothetical protein [Hymenobacter sp.]HLL97287.1 hypothetical protein [Spirosoma sp.]
MTPIYTARNAADEVYAELQYNADRNYLFMRWSGYCTDDELKQATLQMLDWQQTEGQQRACRFHVHDTKEFETAWTRTIDWIVNEFFNKAYAFGLRGNISILSPDLFSKVSSEALQQYPGSLVPTLLFESLMAAEQFIASQPQQEPA